MDEYLLLRSYLHDRTVGVLCINNNAELLPVCVTLERPDLNNKVGKSCILEGTYIVKRDKTGRHQFYAVQNVTNRTDIELHEGVLPRHSAGCLLLGEKFSNEFNLVNSGAAMADFLENQGDESFLLTIRARRAGDVKLIGEGR